MGSSGLFVIVFKNNFYQQTPEVLLIEPNPSRAELIDISHLMHICRQITSFDFQCITPKIILPSYGLLLLGRACWHKSGAGWIEGLGSRLNFMVKKFQCFIKKVYYSARSRRSSVFLKTVNILEERVQPPPPPPKKENILELHTVV